MERSTSRTRDKKITPQSRPSAQDLLREQLAAHDATTRSWVPFIALSIFHLQRRFAIPQDELLDWIYGRDEPVNVFELAEWARARAAA